VLEYIETRPDGKELIFSWVTNIHITDNTCFTLTKGGRSRWKIENETFNTLKNLGYNYGHGKQFLSTNFCLLMLLAFFIDQIQGIACSLFQAVKKKAASFRTLWEDTRVLFKFTELASWEYLYTFMLSGKRFNTS
jgi:hypothetical protein